MLQNSIANILWDPNPGRGCTRSKTAACGAVGRVRVAGRAPESGCSEDLSGVADVLGHLVLVLLPHAQEDHRLGDLADRADHRPAVFFREDLTRRAGRTNIDDPTAASPAPANRRLLMVLMVFLAPLGRPVVWGGFSRSPRTRIVPCRSGPLNRPRILVG